MNMTRKEISNVLIGLLAVFLIGVISFMIAIPFMADSIVLQMIELAPYKTNMIIFAEVLLLMLVSGIIIITRLLSLFKKDLTYTKRFVKGLSILGYLTIVADLTLIGFLAYMISFGAPGPSGIFIIFLILFIFIVAAVIFLVRETVKDAKRYKDENELVV